MDSHVASPTFNTIWLKMPRKQFKLSTSKSGKVTPSKLTSTRPEIKELPKTEPKTTLTSTFKDSAPTPLRRNLKLFSQKLAPLTPAPLERALKPHLWATSNQKTHNVPLTNLTKWMSVAAKWMWAALSTSKRTCFTRMVSPLSLRTWSAPSTTTSSSTTSLLMWLKSKLRKSSKASARSLLWDFKRRRKNQPRAPWSSTRTSLRPKKPSRASTTQRCLEATDLCSLTSGSPAKSKSKNTEIRISRTSRTFSNKSFGK